MIRRRYKARHALRYDKTKHTSMLKEPVKAAAADDDPPTVSSAGTKASSADPYEAVLPSKQEERIEQLASPIEKDFMPMTTMSANQHASLSSSIQYSDSRDDSNLWLEQAQQDQGEDIPIDYYEPSYLAPPSEQDSQRRNGTGTRLRIHPSARDLMASLSSSDSLDTYTSTIQLPTIWFALGSIWLISVSAAMYFFSYLYMQAC